MSTLGFILGCIVCLTVLICTVGICSTIEKIHGKDK